MNEMKYILALVFACFLLGCSNSSKSLRISNEVTNIGELVISVIPNEKNNQFDITPYLDTIKYVKLEMTDESIIGIIEKAVIFEERIYIQDSKTNSLFVFDIDGSYIHKIARIGQGPEEYIQLDFFDIDRKNRHIVITDLMYNRIMRYDLNGKFISKEKIPVWCYGAFVLPNNGIVLYSDFRDNSKKLEQEYNLILYDSLMNISKAFFPYKSKDLNSKIPSISRGGQFYTNDENLYFFFPEGNTIYQITEDSIKIKYRLDFGEDILPYDNSINLEKFSEVITKGKYNGLKSPVYENNQLLFFYMRTSFNMKNGNLFPYYVFYNKESKNQLSSFFFIIENGFNLGAPLTAYDSWIVYYIDSYHLIEWKEQFPKEKIPSVDKFTKEKLSFAEKLVNDDNPALMFIKLKPF